jgi:hypothetical protein
MRDSILASVALCVCERDEPLLKQSGDLLIGDLLIHVFVFQWQLRNLIAVGFVNLQSSLLWRGEAFNAGNMVGRRKPSAVNHQ